MELDIGTFLWNAFIQQGHIKNDIKTFIMLQEIF